MGAAGVDSALAHNASGTRAAGIPAAYYHLFRPEDSGIAQARHFLNTVDDKPYVFLAVDVEKVVDQPLTYYAANRLLITARLHELVTELRKATGVYPYFYTGVWFFDDYIAPTYDDTFGKCLLWLAEYGDKITRIPRAWQTYSLWQYSSSGSVAGIDDKTLDMNRERAAVVAPAFALQPPTATPFRITQVFGARPEYYAQFGLPGHEGVDIGGNDGDLIFAAADGVVKLLAKDDGKHPYGNQIRISSAWGTDTYEVVYAHLRGFKPELVQGDPVRAGDILGYMGSTGNSTGTHLHLSVKHNGVIVDPSLYLIEVSKAA